MTASAMQTDAAFTHFTLSLLKDTGWYSSVNFNIADELFYGKGKGCPFLELACYDTSKIYSEFKTLN